MEATLVSQDLPRCRLGEGPCWDHAAGILYWVDIESRKIHSYTPATKEQKTIDVPKLVGFVVPRGDGKLLAGLQDGVYSIDTHTGEREIVALLPDPEGVRINDGKCDPNGVLWLGTMVMGESTEEKGALYRLDKSGLNEVERGFKTANGKGWSVGGDYFYHADTHRKTVWRYRYAPGGILSGKEKFIETDGRPDGLCVDSTGRIFVSLYGGGRVDIFDSEGMHLGDIKVPVRNVTSCAFGGPDLKTLYITTAESNAEDVSGCLFEVRMDLAGRVEHAAR